MYYWSRKTLSNTQATLKVARHVTMKLNVLFIHVCSSSISIFHIAAIRYKQTYAYVSLCSNHVEFGRRRAHFRCTCHCVQEKNAKDKTRHDRHIISYCHNYHKECVDIN